MDVPAAFLCTQNGFMLPSVCEGIDTLAEVIVNGGTLDTNMNVFLRRVLNEAMAFMESDVCGA
jgi:hypothetical protein